MYHVHGFNLSFNTAKVLLVAEELGVDYQYTALTALGPAEGEHKTPAHLARHPLGKTPTLDHDGKYLFESAVICRYLAASENSPLYPQDDVYQRALVDQWIDFFSLHPGRWLSTLLFERAFRSQFGMGETKKDVEQEALDFAQQQLKMVDEHLAKNGYLAGNALSIADGFAFAYLQTTPMSNFSLEPYANVSRWFDDYKTRSSVDRANAKTGNA